MSQPKMKIAYLMRVRPDLEAITPPDVQGVQVQVGDDGRYSEADLGKVADVDAFVIGMEPVNEQIVAAAKRLKIVQRLGVGYETIDLEACARHGVPACNIDGVNKEAVAEHTMMFILVMAKRLFDANAFIQKADWAAARKLTTETFEIKDKTLGIVGLGDTGSALAKRAAAFEMKLLYNEVREVNTSLAKQLGARRVEKGELFAQSDIVAICTDLNPSSRMMIDAKALAQMRPHARFVCCARGGIVDEAALADALKSGRIAAAGIDVFETEPLKPDNPLIGLPNCILTGHVAGVASDTTARIWAWAHDNIRATVQRGEKPRWVRNGL